MTLGHLEVLSHKRSLSRKKDFLCLVKTTVRFMMATVVMFILIFWYPYLSTDEKKRP